MVATRRPSDSSGMVRKRKQTTPRRVVSKTSASQVSAKAPSANNQRQRVALHVYRNRHSEIVRQLCAMFGQLISCTASPWENQAQEIHRMKETKIAHTVNVRNRRKYSQCQEKMSECELPCFHPDERAPSTYKYCTWL